MTAVQELTMRLKKLPEAKREKIAAALLEEMNARDWDQKIESDARAGKLDDLMKEVNSDIDPGRIRPL